MYLGDAEYQYVQQRVVQSQRMASAAAECCARAVHVDLAARYATRLEAIIQDHEGRTAWSISSEPRHAPAASTFVGLVSSMALPPLMQQPR